MAGDKKRAPTKRVLAPTMHAGERGVRAIAGITLLGVAAVATWQLRKDVNPNATTLGLLLAAVVSMVALVYPHAFAIAARRLTRIDAFGIKLELRVEQARRAIRRFENEEDGVSAETPTWPMSTRQAVDDVANELRSKLRFCSLSLLGDEEGISEEFIIMKLGLGGLLEFDEATLCLELLGGLREELGDLRRDERDEFLGDAWVFAVRFATRMFDRQARRALAANGWSLADFSQGKGHRADFIASRNGAVALVAARVAAPRDGIFRTRNRLAKVGDPFPGIRRVVVVPDHVDHLWPQLSARPVSLGKKVMAVRLSPLVRQHELVMLDENDLERIPEPEAKN